MEHRPIPPQSRQPFFPRLVLELPKWGNDPFLSLPEFGLIRVNDLLSLGFSVSSASSVVNFFHWVLALPGWEIGEYIKSCLGF
jgi:hypothetical protein